MRPIMEFVAKNSKLKEFQSLRISNFVIFSILEIRAIQKSSW